MIARMIMDRDVMIGTTIAAANSPCDNPSSWSSAWKMGDELLFSACAVMVAVFEFWDDVAVAKVEGGKLEPDLVMLYVLTGDWVDRDSVSV